jgi:hypothetical protein
VLAAGLVLCQWPVRALFANWTAFRNEMLLLTVAAIGAVIYGLAIVALFRRDWRDLTRARSGTTPAG